MAGLIQSGLSAILPRDHRVTVTLLVAGAGALALLLEYYKRVNYDVRATSASTDAISYKIRQGNEKLEEAIQSYEQALAELQHSNDSSKKMRIRAMLLRAYEIQALLSPEEFNMRSSMMIEGVPSDIIHVVREGGRESNELDTLCTVPRQHSFRARTISDISDLSDYMEAFEELVSDAEEGSYPALYELTLIRHRTSNFTVRNDRVTLANVSNSTEYAVKVQCIRQAFDSLLLDVTKQLWMKDIGRNQTIRLLEIAGADTTVFSETFDAMLLYTTQPEHLASIMIELKARRVPCINIFDIVIDFCLLDSFDDLDRPPGAITSIIGNSWISQGVRKSMLSTAVSSLINSKRGRANPGGFICHFYDIMGVLAPALAWGFLGDDPILHPLCVLFRQQCNAVMRQMFDHTFVNYYSVETLARDLYELLREAADEFKVELDAVNCRTSESRT